MNETEEIIVTAKEALDKGIVSSEMLIYQLYLARKFLEELGIPEDVLRFRQHLPGEMAHYALDCWDVECKTDKYGWVEIIGIADRGNYDLTAHSKESNEELNVYIPYDEAKIVKKTIIRPNMAKFGPSFKQYSPKVKAYLDNLSSEEVQELKTKIENEGKYIIKLDTDLELLPEHIKFEDIEEELKGEKIIPHVIEPSFGIDRILYCVLLHSFVDEGEKEYFKFKKEIAPIQISVFPLQNKKEMPEISQKITNSLREEGYSVDYNISGSIGKRYAKADEIGIPLAITVDFDSIEDNSVTVRNRDTEEQERININKLNEYINNYFNE